MGEELKRRKGRGKSGERKRKKAEEQWRKVGEVFGKEQVKSRKEVDNCWKGRGNEQKEEENYWKRRGKEQKGIGKLLEKKRKIVERKWKTVERKRKRVERKNEE